MTCTPDPTEVDELDQLGVDQHALLEAMEQQTVSVAKAGIVARLASGLGCK